MRKYSRTPWTASDYQYRLAICPTDNTQAECSLFVESLPPLVASCIQKCSVRASSNSTCVPRPCYSLARPINCAHCWSLKFQWRAIQTQLRVSWEVSASDLFSLLGQRLSQLGKDEKRSKSGRKQLTRWNKKPPQVRESRIFARQELPGRIQLAQGSGSSPICPARGTWSSGRSSMTQAMSQ